MSKPQWCVVVALNSNTPDRILDMLPGEKVATSEETKAGSEAAEEEELF